MHSRFASPKRLAKLLALGGIASPKRYSIVLSCSPVMTASISLQIWGCFCNVDIISQKKHFVNTKKRLFWCGRAKFISALFFAFFFASSFRILLTYEKSCVKIALQGKTKVADASGLLDLSRQALFYQSFELPREIPKRMRSRKKAKPRKTNNLQNGKEFDLCLL